MSTTREQGPPSPRRFPDINYIARDYLRAKTEDKREEYLDRMIAYCFRASGNLYIPIDGPNVGEDRTTLFQEKRYFIMFEILEFLDRYTGCCTPREIEQLACIGEFRYLARRVKFRMIDHIRKWYRQRQPRVEFSLDFMLSEDPEDETTTADTIAHDVNQYGSTLADHVPVELVFEFVDESKEEFLALFGKSGLEVLLTAVDLYPHFQGKTKRERKGMLARGVAKRRQVSQRQARTDIRRTKDKAAKALEGGNKAARGLHKLLDEGPQPIKKPKGL